MHHHAEHSFIDEFWWVSPLQYAALLWWTLQAEPPSLHYYCAVVLHSCIVLPPVGHSSNHEYYCCQLTRQSSCVSNFYRTFTVFILLSLVVKGVLCLLYVSVHWQVMFKCSVLLLLLRPLLGSKISLALKVETFLRNVGTYLPNYVGTYKHNNRPPEQHLYSHV